MSKSTSDGNYLAFMKLTPNQVNTFEGVLTTNLVINGYNQVAVSNHRNYTCKIYLKITAYGDFIINPMICTVETESDSDIKTETEIILGKVTHNESGDILIIASIRHGLMDSSTMTIEGSTNSPTDYESLSWNDLTLCNIIDCSKYYSSIDYTIYDGTCISAGFNLGRQYIILTPEFNRLFFPTGKFSKI